MAPNKFNFFKLKYRDLIRKLIKSQSYKTALSSKLNVISVQNFISWQTIFPKTIKNKDMH